MMDQATIDKIKPYILKDHEGRREICSIYKHKELMDEMIDYLTEPYMGKVDYVAAPESLGFILGSMIAAKLGVGFVPIRNGAASELGEDAVRAVYVDHRDRARSLQARNDEQFKGARFLIVDDWVETAATIQASLTILEQMQAKAAGIVCIGVDENRATAKMIANETLRFVIKK